MHQLGLRLSCHPSRRFLTRAQPRAATCVQKGSATFQPSSILFPGKQREAPSPPDVPASQRAQPASFRSDDVYEFHICTLLPHPQPVKTAKGDRFFKVLQGSSQPQLHSFTHSFTHALTHSLTHSHFGACAPHSNGCSSKKKVDEKQKNRT